MKRLYTFLEGYTFGEEAEVYLAVLQFMEEDLGIENPSYDHCIIAQKLAERYIASKNIVFDK